MLLLFLCSLELKFIHSPPALVVIGVIRPERSARIANCMETQMTTFFADFQFKNNKGFTEVNIFTQCQWILANFYKPAQWGLVSRSCNIEPKSFRLSAYLLKLGPTRNFSFHLQLVWKESIHRKYHDRPILPTCVASVFDVDDHFCVPLLRVWGSNCWDWQW